MTPWHAITFICNFSGFIFFQPSPLIRNTTDWKRIIGRQVDLTVQYFGTISLGFKKGVFLIACPFPLQGDVYDGFQLSVSCIKSQSTIISQSQLTPSEVRLELPFSFVSSSPIYNVPGCTMRCFVCNKRWRAPCDMYYTTSYTVDWNWRAWRKPDFKESNNSDPKAKTVNYVPSNYCTCILHILLNPDFLFILFSHELWGPPLMAVSLG